MLQCPKSMHKIHKFTYNGRFYVADINRTKVIEVDELVWKVLDLVCDHTNEEIIKQLSATCSESEVIDALEVLEELEKRRFLFHKNGNEVVPISSEKNRPRIFIPQWMESFYSDITYMPAGTNVALYHMVKHLSKYADIYLGGFDENKVSDGVYQIPLTLAEVVSSPWRLNQYNFDGILALHEAGHLSLLPLFQCNYVPPVILQIHAPRGHGGNEINSILLHYSAMREFDAFTAPSDYVAKFYSAFVWDTSFFHTLPNGVEADFFMPMNKRDAKQQVAQMVGDSRIPGKLIVGYLSRFQSEKGASIYLKIAQMNPDAIFLVAGPTLGRYSLRELPQNVIYAGFHRRETLPIIYNAFDVYCFPSMSGEETFGLTVLEAMSCGVPPVVPDFDGLPEVVGDAGVIVKAENFADDIASFAGHISAFDMSEKISFLLNDESERIRLGKKSRERALSFSWDRTARKILEIFAELNEKKKFSFKISEQEVLFAPYWERDQQRIIHKSILLSLNSNEENNLILPAYLQSVEEGTAIGLLTKHSLREVEAVVRYIIDDEEKSSNILKKVKGFIEAIS